MIKVSYDLFTLKVTHYLCFVLQLFIPKTPYSGQKPTRLVNTKTPVIVKRIYANGPSTTSKYTKRPAPKAKIIRITLSKPPMLFFIALKI